MEENEPLVAQGEPSQEAIFRTFFRLQYPYMAYFLCYFLTSSAAFRYLVEFKLVGIFKVLRQKLELGVFWVSMSLNLRSKCWACCSSCTWLQLRSGCASTGASHCSRTRLSVHSLVGASVWCHLLLSLLTWRWTTGTATSGSSRPSPRSASTAPSSAPLRTVLWSSSCQNNFPTQVALLSSWLLIFFASLKFYRHVLTQSSLTSIYFYKNYWKRISKTFHGTKRWNGVFIKQKRINRIEEFFT